MAGGEGGGEGGGGLASSCALSLRTLVWSSLLYGVALSTSGLEETGSLLCVTVAESHFDVFLECCEVSDVKKESGGRI